MELACILIITVGVNILHARFICLYLLFSMVTNGTRTCYKHTLV